MASDQENQDPAAVAAPTPEESETKTDPKAARGDGKAESKPAESKAADSPSEKGDAKSQEPKDAESKADANGKPDPAAGRPPGASAMAEVRPRPTRRTARSIWWSSRT